MNIESMYANAELRPFIPAVLQLKQRLNGIEHDCEPLGLHFEQLTESEEQMLHALLSQKAFVFDAINEVDDRWDIRIESFFEFKTRSQKVEFAFTGYNPVKLSQISAWIIQMCDWDGSLFTLTNYFRGSSTAGIGYMN